jgi:hypothetical protein
MLPLSRGRKITGVYKMNGIAKWAAVALALLLGSIAANAQTATYAFTGVVTSSRIPHLTVGEYVTGTYTFNYNSADTTIGNFSASLRTWAIGSTGFPYNPVFACSVNIGGSTVYLSSPTGFAIDPDNSSIVTDNGNSSLSASESLPASDSSSFFAVVETDLAKLGGPSSNELPETLSATQNGYGGFLVAAVGLRYEITSLTLAPAPPPATLLATLLTEATGVGPGDKLARDVERAQADYAAGEITETCDDIARFLKTVQSKNGKTITATLDITLTRGAQAIAATIDCQQRRVSSVSSS